MRRQVYVLQRTLGPSLRRARAVQSSRRRGRWWRRAAGPRAGTRSRPATPAAPGHSRGCPSRPPTRFPDPATGGRRSGGPGWTCRRRSGPRARRARPRQWRTKRSRAPAPCRRKSSRPRGGGPESPPPPHSVDNGQGSRLGQFAIPPHGGHARAEPRVACGRLGEEVRCPDGAHRPLLEPHNPVGHLW